MTAGKEHTIPSEDERTQDTSRAENILAGRENDFARKPAT
jgi:hypothetical protein